MSDICILYSIYKCIKYKHVIYNIYVCDIDIYEDYALICIT